MLIFNFPDQKMHVMRLLEKESYLVLFAGANRVPMIDARGNEFNTKLRAYGALFNSFVAVCALLVVKIALSQHDIAQNKTKTK